MILTLSTTMQNARDLGYLVVKHPDRLHQKSVAYGQAHVFFPEATNELCTVALLLNIDPIGLSRKSRGTPDFALQPYVNDRPYVASSFLSVAIAKMFSTAMKGECPEKPELADQSIPLSIKIPVLPCRGGETFLRQLFQPLGYELEVHQHPWDEHDPIQDASSPYFSVTLTTEQPLSKVLTHLYVLLPVMDDEKHYWVSEDEVEKLLQRGEGWLDVHPAKEHIIRRYLIHQKHLTRLAVQRLEEPELLEANTKEQVSTLEAKLEGQLKQNDIRLQTVVEALAQEDCHNVLDMGCGEGKLMKLLSKNKQFQKIAGSDVCIRTLRKASERLHFERLSPKAKERFELFQGSVVYRDKRFEGFDGVAVVEVIEHIDPHRLDHFTQVLFAHSRPRVAVITTPNADFNATFDSLPAGKFRHPDHRFEWTRKEFQEWAHVSAEEHGYTVRFEDVGPCDETLGAPTQMGVFVQCV